MILASEKTIQNNAPLEDVQGTPDERQISINRVGIKDIEYPIRIGEKSGTEQHTVASFSMYVYLPKQFKGTHMSRFVEILNAHEKEITVDSFQKMLPELTDRLNSDAAYLEMKFPYFIEKTAPVSGVKSQMNYQATLMGKIENGQSTITLKVVVPVTSLCPCSKTISTYGAHNQRSHITINAEIRTGSETLWLEDLIQIAESNGSCELWGILKRPDEKYVTERAYENPKFVEDIVRDVAKDLEKDSRIVDFIVESENFESIHNHSAYARIEKKSNR